MTAPDIFIHPMATVDGSARIHAKCRVWQFATVRAGTVLGEGCNVGANAVLEGAKFGARCKIGPGVHMGPGFEIGDDVFIGSNTVFCNDAWPSVVRDGFDDEALRSGEAVCVRVGNGAAIGANCTILPGVVIGEGATIAAGACVSADVPPGHLLCRDGTLRDVRALERKRMRVANPTYMEAHGVVNDDAAYDPLNPGSWSWVAPESGTVEVVV